ncbi:hypothetical protein CYMTET_23385 [Cymbomonas tetramitiformis]|uniref:Polycystin cation channel PKD1/PKD2 domain-containing protein n=1 Tax=Cymbomonas tetramitiformis TaxID=36881 RepID=A0AAE0L103_9CHLO|nr:hypothetical protein CYMTET_23385 [Cymbomonas tetramitiformis]
MACSMVLTHMLIMRSLTKSKSANRTEDTMGGLASIPWGSDALEPARKKALFFEELEVWLDFMEAEDNEEHLLNQLLGLLIIRLIIATGFHPRLALLTGTIKHSLDDLFHATILVMLILNGFASVGWWRFGDERDEFASLEVSICTLTEIAAGNFLEDWSETSELALFTSFYSITMFVVVLNFLLAIIVEAYMQVGQTGGATGGPASEVEWANEGRQRVERDGAMSGASRHCLVTSRPGANGVGQQSEATGGARAGVLGGSQQAEARWANGRGNR